VLCWAVPAVPSVVPSVPSVPSCFRETRLLLFRLLPRPMYLLIAVPSAIPSFRLLLGCPVGTVSSWQSDCRDGIFEGLIIFDISTNNAVYYCTFSLKYPDLWLLYVGVII